MYDAMFGKNAGAATGGTTVTDGGVMGGGGGGSNAVDPNEVAIQKLRDDRANAVTPPVNYDTSGSGSNPFGYLDDVSVSPGFDNSRRNYNSTPTPPPAQTYDTSGGNPFGYSDAPVAYQSMDDIVAQYRRDLGK